MDNRAICDEYREAVCADMLRILQSESILDDDVRTLRSDQVRLADWLCTQERYDEALEQYGRAAGLDEHLLRTKNTVPELRNADLRMAAENFLKTADILSLEGSKGDPIVVYEKALAAAAALREEADAEADALAVAADYGIACALWAERVFSKSIMYYDRATRENGGGAFSRAVGLPPEERLELQKCYAAVLERLKQSGRQIAPENLLSLSGKGERSADELETLSCCSEAIAAVLFDMGLIKGAIREQRACIAFGLQLLEKRRLPGDYVTLSSHHTALADMLDAAGDTDEGLYTRKLAAHILKQASMSK